MVCPYDAIRSRWKAGWHRRLCRSHPEPSLVSRPSPRNQRLFWITLSLAKFCDCETRTDSIRLG